MEGEYFEKHPDTTCIVAPDQVGLTKKSNASLDPRTNYTDLHVVAGYKYYYVATAVNLKGQESKYSKQVEAVIP